MSRKLYVYKDFTPNLENATHYVFTNSSTGIAKYLSKCGGTSNVNRVAYLDDTNYRINNNSLVLAFTGDVLSYWNRITYVVERDSVTGYFMSYFVETPTIASGNIYFNLRVDYWASYFYKSTLSDINVTRTNREVPNAIFDNIETFKSTSVNDRVLIPFEYDYKHDGYGFNYDNNLAVILVCDCKFPTATIGQNVKTIQMFCTTLKDIRQACQNQYGQTFSLSSYEIAMTFCGGVSGWYPFGTSSSSRDCTTIRAYLMPLSWVDVDYSNSKYIHSYPALGNNSQLTRLLCYSLKQSYKFLSFPLPELDINFKWYFGTISGGLPIRKTTTNKLINLEIIIGSTCNVIARQDESTQDISEMFLMPLIQSESDIANFELRNSLNLGVDGLLSSLGVLGAIASAGSGGVGGALIGGAMSAGSVAKKAIAKSNKQVTLNTSPRGNASVTFAHLITSSEIDDDAVNAPLYFIGYASNADEEAKARIEGASCNLYVGSIRDLLNYDLLGTGTLTDTLIICDCDIEGVPITAREEIAKQLKEGVYYAVI